MRRFLEITLADIDKIFKRQIKLVMFQKINLAPICFQRSGFTFLGPFKRNLTTCVSKVLSSALCCEFEVASTT